MKKIAILTTYYNNNNYGGVLQAYALQKYITKLGFDAIDVCYVDVYNVESQTFSFREKMIMNFEGKTVIERVKLIYILGRRILKKIIYSKKIEKLIQNRNKRFSEFRTREIKHSKEVYSKDDIELCQEKYDAFICGSDLVWSIGDTSNLQPGYWLTFVKDKPKFSYAASLPMTSVNLEQRNKICAALKDYQAIAVREKQGKKLLDEILGEKQKVFHVVDPVFLLDKNEWGAFSSNQNVCFKKYILTYFLGDSMEYRKLVQEISRTEGIPIVNIAHVQKFQENDLKYGEAYVDKDPKDFVGLLKNASLVVTDSFHGAAFSILFRKEFYVVERFKATTGNTLNIRLYSLMERLKCRELILKGKSKEMFKQYKTLMGKELCDYEELEKWIETSKQYLIDNLNKI